MTWCRATGRRLAAALALVALGLATSGCQWRERICQEGEVPVYGERGEGLACLDAGADVPEGWRVVEVDGEVPVYLDDPAYRTFQETTWKDLVEQHGDDPPPSIPPVLTEGDGR